MKPTRAVIIAALAAGIIGLQTTEAHAEPQAIDVKVSFLDGTAFLDGADRPLFDPLALRLAPGSATTGTVLVANHGTSPGHLRVKALGVSDHENGCNEPEGLVDRTCDGDQGEMSGALTVTAFVDSTGEHRPATEPAWDGSFEALSSGVAFDRPLGPGEIWSLTLALEVPRAAGNELQSDDVSFALGFTLTEDDQAPGDGGAETVVLGETVTQELLDPGGASDTVIVGELPRTGFAMGSLAALGGAFTVVGWVGRVAVRRRRGRAA